MIQTIKIMRYEYGITNPIKVWVDMEKPCPDPLKRLIWGRSESNPDEIVSDFKGLFSRIGNPIHFKANIKGLTAMDEQKQKVEAIKSYIRKITKAVL